MKRQSIRRQTAVTVACGVLNRGLGFLLRLTITKRLGPEAVGVMELASGAHMLALTPVAAGLPGAVSRMTARADGKEKKTILRAGRQWALRMALAVTPLLLLLSPLIARAMGDMRVLPSLVLFAPCILLVGLSGTYDGYCYGIGSAWPPALSELSEQIARMAVVLGLSFLLPSMTVAGRAALPALAGTVGEGVGLLVVMAAVGRVPPGREDKLPQFRRELARLSLPLMAGRMTHTALRTVNGVLIPKRLMAAGLTAQEAVSRLGMLNGMVLPLLFIPGMLAGALGTVGGPAAARCGDRKAENRLVLRLLLPALAAGMLCCAGLRALAPWLARRVYRLPELMPLLRALSPMAVLMPVQQVLSGCMAGLGLQKKSLTASLIGAGAALLFTWLWTADPALHIYGAGFASMLGHALTLLCSGISFILR